MQNNVTQNLNNILNIETELEDPVEVVPAEFVPETKSQNSADIQTDYDFARKNIHDVIEKGTYALDYLLEVAKSSDHPRAFEVVSQLSKTIVDANKDLLDIQKKMKELQDNGPKAPNNVNNNLFVGSTAEVLKMLRDKNGDNDL